MKVGIIGGGIAGLASAWLLDEEHEVILFEKRDRLGGHAHTTYVQTPQGPVAAETGFEFFNDAMFPHFVRLLSILQVPTQAYPFSYTFFSQNNDNVYLLPPIRNGKIFWHMFSPSKLFTMLQLKYLLNKSKAMVETKDSKLTLQQFLNSVSLTDWFKNDFFVPIFCSGWGVTPEMFNTFSAYNLMAWEINNQKMGLQACPWNEIPGGVSSYIAALVGQIKRSTLKTASGIATIDYDGTQYTLTDDNGNKYSVDHLIVATNAYEAHDLLKNIPEIKQVSSLLNKVEYIHATIAIHGDVRFMPKNKADWSIANVWYDGKNSTLTTHKPWRSEIPLFRSWLMPGFPMPEPVYSVDSYYHAEITPAYFQVQKELAPLQGQHNLWVAGLYTHDIDSHENALVSTLKVAKKIAPQSRRCKLLCDEK